MMKEPDRLTLEEIQTSTWDYPPPLGQSETLGLGRHSPTDLRRVTHR